jgi:hypothetical protein
VILGERALEGSALTLTVAGRTNVEGRPRSHLGRAAQGLALVRVSYSGG